MTGLSGPAADLGLSAVMAAAQNKLLSAMPARLRAGAEQMRARFHLDAPAWFAHAEKPQYLPLVADAVWAQRRIRIRYQSWKAEKATYRRAAWPGSEERRLVPRRPDQW